MDRQFAYEGRGPDQSQSQDRTGIDRPPGMLEDARRDVARLDDRIAPVIEADQLREQLSAKRMTVAADPVDLQDLAHQATATLAGSEIVRQRRC